MSVLDDLKITLDQFCKLHGLPDPETDYDLTTALEMFVAVHNATELLEATRRGVKKGLLSPCFIPAAEIRNLLGLPDCGGIPAGRLGTLYLDAAFLFQEHGWRKKTRNIKGVLITGYLKEGHADNILYVREINGVRTMALCLAMNYHKVKL